MTTPAIGWLTLCCCLASAAQERPNIVLIVSDDQGWTDYSFMGHAKIQTPNLDALAKQSVLFRNGYVPTALCRPSLMTMVTGLYAHQHGVTGNDPSPRYAKRGTQQDIRRREQLIRLIDAVPTVPKLLANRGYRCHQSGKWWEGGFARGGFTHGMTRGFPQKGGRHGDDGLQIGRQGLAPIKNFIDQAVAQGQPFFVWYAPFMPHTPHTPPKHLLNKYQSIVESEKLARYFAMCEWFDETVGQLRKHLARTRIQEDTLIVYVCDNGWIQDPDRNGYAARSKQTPYEGGVRSPIMFCWPNHFQPNDRTELCSSIDLAPTILSAAGIQPTRKMPGLNLLNHLKYGKPIQRDLIFGESFAHDIADLEKPEASLLHRWCRNGNWKLILTYDGEVNRYKTTHPRTDKRPQLFDLSKDPFEKTNLAGDNPTIVSELAKAIKNWYPVNERKVIEAWSN